MDAETAQALPSWRHTGNGTMVRAALWLVQEVGEGNTFTSEQLHSAFSGMSQINRRLRDLRDFDWQIETHRSDPTLGTSEMRFVSAGEPVWEPGRRTKRTRRLVASTQRRREIFERDGFTCVQCGTARPLDVAYLVPMSAGGRDTPDNLITLCANCHAEFDRGTRELPGVEEVWEKVQALSLPDRVRLLAWIAANGKPLTPVEEAWTDYRRLPPQERSALAHRLGQAVIDQTSTAPDD